jgi:hypothetical protein
MDHRVRTRSVRKTELLNEWQIERGGEEPLQPARDRLLDINTADPRRLMSLNGIGVHYAAKILEGRPYRGREDLLVRHILPSHVYSRIMHRLYVDLV